MSAVEHEEHTALVVLAAAHAVILAKDAALPRFGGARAPGEAVPYSAFCAALEADTSEHELMLLLRQESQAELAAVVALHQGAAKALERALKTEPGSKSASTQAWAKHLGLLRTAQQDLLALRPRMRTARMLEAAFRRLPAITDPTASETDRERAFREAELWLLLLVGESPD